MKKLQASPHHNEPFGRDESSKMQDSETGQCGWGLCESSCRAAPLHSQPATARL